MAKKAKFTRQFLVRFEPQMFLELEKFADKNNREVVEVVREAVKEKLERENVKMNEH